MNCPKCGQVNNENAKFCGKCGAVMEHKAPPPVPPVLTPQPPPIQSPHPGGFLDQMVSKSGMLGLILLALFFFPWGKNAVHPVMTSMQTYSKQFIYISGANFVLPLAANGIAPAGTGIYLLHFLLLFIPLTALTVLLWKTGRKVYPILSVVFSFLGTVEIIRTMVLEITSGELRVSFLNIFEGLCLLYMLFILVVSILLLIRKPQTNRSSVQLDPMLIITPILGFVLAVVFWLPIQVILQIKLVISFLNIEQSPFMLPSIIRGNLLLKELGLPNPIPFGRQVLFAIFGILLLSIFASAVFAVLSALGKRKHAFLLLGFSAFGLIILFLRMRVIPLLTSSIMLKKAVPLRYLFNNEMSVFYYLQILLLIGLLVCSIILLSRKRINAA